MKNLKVLRKQQNISMKKLGEIIGVAESTISLYESGKRQPDKDTLIRIADYFCVSVDYLLGATDKKNLPSELTEGEKKFIELFRRVPEDKQELVLQVIRVAITNK